MLQLKIEQDQDAQNPRKEWDHFTTMICHHSRYSLGDEQAQGMGDYEEAQEAADWWLPLYLYDHSGITMSTGPFGDPWDSGQVGIITITKAQLEATGLEVTEENAKKVMQQEVEEYDMYLRGDVWGYTITDTANGEIEDSCWGFYGREYVEQEANEALERLTKRREHMMPYQATVDILIPGFDPTTAKENFELLMNGLVERDAILDWQYGRDEHMRELVPAITRYGTFKKLGEDAEE